MKKIAIFENEYESVRFAFETANLVNFNNELKLNNYPSSQSVDLKEILGNTAIFIDIDLSINSQYDGYTLISKLTQLNQNIAKKIVILTGNNKIQQSLTQLGIISPYLQILIKPTNYIDISNAINKVIIAQTQTI